MSDEHRPAVVDKWDGKTIRLKLTGNDAYYGSRIYRISVEYVEDTLLEVNLIPLTDDGSIASSNFDFHASDAEDKIETYGKHYLAAIRKAKEIARDIESELDVDFESDE